MFAIIFPLSSTKIVGLKRPVPFVRCDGIIKGLIIPPLSKQCFTKLFIYIYNINSLYIFFFKKSSLQYLIGSDFYLFKINERKSSYEGYEYLFFKGNSLKTKS